MGETRSHIRILVVLNLTIRFIQLDQRLYWSPKSLERNKRLDGSLIKIDNYRHYPPYVPVGNLCFLLSSTRAAAQQPRQRWLYIFLTATLDTTRNYTITTGCVSGRVWPGQAAEDANAQLRVYK